MKFKKIIIFLSLLFFIFSCSGAKDALQGKKRSENSDEFLIEKKNPLTVPPDMNELPVPLDQEDENLNENEEEIDIKKVLINNESEDIDTDIDDEGIDDLEKSIIEKIND
tara:strand:+ start:2902 stop:3231 length:330 start_codon:yes stop_codon:yes gene_type:complete